MQPFLIVASNVLLGAGASLTPELIMSDVHTDEHLQLLQVSAKRHQQAYEGGLAPESGQGPYQTLGVNTVCPDDQVLTLRQCTEAAWSQAVPGVNLAFHVYGAQNAPHHLPGPRGCWFLTLNKGVYYNANPTGSPDGRIQPVCSVNGGRVAQKQEEAALPAGGVFKKAFNTMCDECGVLNLDECKLAGESLGLMANQNAAQGDGWPLYASFQNPHTRVNQWASPQGCFQANNNVVYWNMDTTDDQYDFAPLPSRAPICKACPTTTTTTPAPPPPPVEEVAPGDQAEAVADPHIATNTGRHFDMQN